MSELSGARDGEFDVVEFLRYVRRRWRSVAVAAVLGAGIVLAGVASQIASDEVQPTVVTIVFRMRPGAAPADDVLLYRAIFQQSLADEATKQVTSPVTATFTGDLATGLTMTVSSLDAASATAVAERIALESKRLADQVAARRGQMVRARAALSSIIEAKRSNVELIERMATDAETIAFLRRIPGALAERELLLARLRLHLAQLNQQRSLAFAAAAERARDVLDRTPNEQGVPEEVTNTLAELQRTGGFRIPDQKSEAAVDVLVAAPPTVVAGDPPRSLVGAGAASLAAGGAAGITVALAFLLLAFTKQMTSEPQG